MEFSYLRAILEDLRLELGVVFEHGLAHAERQEQNLRTCAGRLAENGMEIGAGMVDALCGQLARSRLDARWQSGEAAALFARIWKYVGICLRRLEFLEAEANLSE